MIDRNKSAGKEVWDSIFANPPKKSNPIKCHCSGSCKIKHRRYCKNGKGDFRHTGGRADGGT